MHTQPSLPVIADSMQQREAAAPKPLAAETEPSRGPSTHPAAPSFNLELLHIFIAVAQFGSINRASRALMQTQPAISKKIRQLERFFRRELFIRSPTGMELTRAGRLLLPRARELTAEFADLRDQMAGSHVSAADLRLGSLDSIASYRYPTFFANAFSCFASVSIAKTITDLIDPFNRGELDLAIMDTAFGKDLTGPAVGRTLFEEPYRLVSRPGNPKVDSLGPGTISASDLHKLPLLMYPAYCPIHQRIGQILGSVGLPMPEIIEIDYSESTVAMVANSDYVTILPESQAQAKAGKEGKSLESHDLDIAFTRSVSLFAREPQALDLVLVLLTEDRD